MKTARYAVACLTLVAACETALALFDTVRKSITGEVTAENIQTPLTEHRLLSEVKLQEEDGFELLYHLGNILDVESSRLQ
jgi:hypothetical protein